MPPKPRTLSSDELMQRYDRMVAMLRELEWVSHTTVGLEYNETTPLFCPICDQEKDYGHQRKDEYREPCPLDALLNEVDRG
jgi:hypothetical protein